MGKDCSGVGQKTGEEKVADKRFQLKESNLERSSLSGDRQQMGEI